MKEANFYGFEPRRLRGNGNHARAHLSRRTPGSPELDAKAACAKADARNRLLLTIPFCCSQAAGFLGFRWLDPGEIASEIFVWVKGKP